MKNVYAILGVKATDSDADIHKRYKRLAAMHHPDHGGDPSQMAAINEAYNLINTPDKRKAYDRKNAFSTEFGLWNTAFGTKPDVASSFGKPPTDGVRAVHGGDVTVKVSVPMRFFLNGGIIPVKYRRKHVCQECSGTGGSRVSRCAQCGGKGATRRPSGLEWIVSKCGKCNGSGMKVITECKVCGGAGVSDLETVTDVKVYPMHETVKIPGRGDDGMYGGTNGNLLIQVVPKDDGAFHWDGGLCATVDVPYDLMRDGGFHRIPYDGDEFVLSVPPMTKCGTVVTGSLFGKPDVKCDFTLMVDII